MLAPTTWLTSPRTFHSEHGVARLQSSGPTSRNRRANSSLATTSKSTESRDGATSASLHRVAHTGKDEPDALPLIRRTFVRWMRKPGAGSLRSEAGDSGDGFVAVRGPACEDQGCLRS